MDVRYVRRAGRASLEQPTTTRRSSSRRCGSTARQPSAADRPCGRRHPTNGCLLRHRVSSSPRTSSLPARAPWPLASALTRAVPCRAAPARAAPPLALPAPSLRNFRAKCRCVSSPPPANQAGHRSGIPLRPIFERNWRRIAREACREVACGHAGARSAAFQWGLNAAGVERTGRRERGFDGVSLRWLPS